MVMKLIGLGERGWGSSGPFGQFDDDYRQHVGSDPATSDQRQRVKGTFNCKWTYSRVGLNERGYS